MPKRLDITVAPSGTEFVPGGIVLAITEFKGNANPRIPEKLSESDSLTTFDAAAIPFYPSFIPQRNEMREEKGSIKINTGSVTSM